ncbi:hypothetical protein LguiA_014763 [Lonicera macranthoides]
MFNHPRFQVAARLMEATSSNPGVVLSICVAYSSSDEMVNSVQKLCNEKWDESRSEELNAIFEVGDFETRMYMAFAPEPEMMIRSSGENRLRPSKLYNTRFLGTE